MGYFYRRRKPTIKRFSPQVRSQIESLSLEQLEALSKVLLDFSSLENLTNWLRENWGE